MLEFKQEAVSLADSGQIIAEVTRTLRTVGQMLFN